MRPQHHYEVFMFVDILIIMSLLAFCVGAVWGEFPRLW